MKLLKLLLYVASIMCLSGFMGVFIPLRFIAPIARRYGTGGVAAGPFFLYAFRLAMAVISGCSVFFFFLGRDPRRHGVLVPASGGMLIFVGCVLAVSGTVHGIHPGVYLLDLSSSGLLGAAIVSTWYVWGREPQGKG